MSMLTCCPTCATVFKVVPDQLRISQGWVRCGNCSEIFDATEHLQDRHAPAAASPGALPPCDAADAGLADAGLQAERERQENAARQAAEAALLAEALAFAGRAAPSAHGPAEEGYPAFTLLRADDVLPVREGDSALPPADPLDPREPSAPGRDAAAPAPEAPAAPPRDPDEPEDLGDFNQPLAPGFVQEARRRAVWHRPAVRVGLALTGLVLVALLALQLALHDRDRLAARAPALAGPLQALCGWTGCTVLAPREIEAIAIDSSTFTKLRPDGYRLALTLKNAAAHPVAMPALELTLTDSQDQPVLRRVLTPAELGASSEVLAAASEWTGSLALTVLPAGDPARVSGYRVLAFYP